MANDFIDNLEKNLEDGEKQKNTPKNNEDTEQNKNEQTVKFRLEKKNNINTKVQIPLYVEDEIVRKLDKMKTKYNMSRNEIITDMIEFALNHME